MTTTEEIQSTQLDGKSLLALVTGGDCSRLSDEQKLLYYRARCDAAGLDYRATPFSFISMQGRLVLYALKGATDQLASNHGIVLEVVGQATEAGIRTVTVRARSKDGRQTDEIGCVNVEGLKGDALANAYMKAVTKAKRRAVLSICGLGMTDETELETIPQTSPVLGLPPKLEAVPPPKPLTPYPSDLKGLMEAAKITKEQLQSMTGKKSSKEMSDEELDYLTSVLQDVLDGNAVPRKSEDGRWRIWCDVTGEVVLGEEEKKPG